MGDIFKKRGSKNNLYRSGFYGEIELLRFIFSVIIILSHSQNFLDASAALFVNGSFAVEFFFILSGFLMMKSIDRMNENSNGLGVETIKFIKKKYLSLCPDMIISWIIGIIAIILITKCSLSAVLDILMGASWEISLVTMTGIKGRMINDAVWYLSSMLLCMVVMYPILRKYKRMAGLVIIPLISLFIIGWFMIETGSIRYPLKWMGFTYRGNLRAFADMGLGILLYHIVVCLKGKQFTVFFKWMLTIFKITGVCFLVMYMYIAGGPVNSFDLLGIAIIMLVIGLIFSDQTYGNNICNNRFVLFLGKFSLPLYLSHYYWSKLMNNILPVGFNNNVAVICYLIISFLTAAVVMFVSLLIKKYRLYLKIKTLFVK